MSLREQGQIYAVKIMDLEDCDDIVDVLREVLCIQPAKPSSLHL